MFDNVAKIEFAVSRFIELNDSSMKRMFAELITKAAKTAILEKYSSIQRLVDEIVFSKEMRAEIENLIRESVKKEVEQHIKDMFGEGRR
jgi:type III secretory pathway component EscV